MNNLVIILSACLCLSFSYHNTALDNNPINHVVSYESYTTMSLPSETGDQECLKNFYLFSNHLEKTIQVKYKELGENQEVHSIILNPLVEKENSNGRKQTITKPERIGETCDFIYEIIEASYID